MQKDIFLKKINPSIDAVLFDLDGTLLDTAPDLVLALNNLLKSKNKPPADYEVAKYFVSQGAAALTKHGFPEVTDEEKFEDLRLEFLDHYKSAVCVDTVAFDGIEELLASIENNTNPWGIVTNKPGWLTTPLLEKMSLLSRSSCVVSGDTLPLRKPHPDPLLHACKSIHLSPANTVYLGDDPRDIYAGNAAGMYTCIAAYGYIDKDIDIESWGADFIIHHPSELLEHIQLNSNAN